MINFKDTPTECIYSRYSKVFGKFVVLFIDGPPGKQCTKLEFFDNLYRVIDFSFIGGDKNLFSTNFNNLDDADGYLLMLEEYFFKMDLINLPLHINDKYPINVVTNLLIADSDFEERRTRMVQGQNGYGYKKPKFNLPQEPL